MGLAEFTNGQGPDVGGYGADVFGTLWATPWLGVDGHLQFVASDAGVQFSFFPELRLRVTGTDPAQGGLSIAAGFGARFPSDQIPRGTVGAVADIPVSPQIFIRPQVRYLFADLATPGAGQFGLGVVWRPKAKVVPPPPPPDPVVEPVAPVVSVDPGDAMVWLPHPVCQWVPASQLAATAATLSSEDLLRFVAAGYLPRVLPAGDLAEVKLTPAPPQGSVVVVGRPGDEVRLAGQTLRAASDGVALVSVPEGIVSGTVVGGGRTEAFEVAVGSGFAVWVRASDPEPLRMGFAQGSAEVGAADRERIAALAASAGGWTFVVRGSASAEGDPAANGVLADRRAAAVAALLYAAGVPASQVTVSPPVVAPPDLPVDAARSVLLVAVPARGAP